MNQLSSNFGAVDDVTLRPLTSNFALTPHAGVCALPMPMPMPSQEENDIRPRIETLRPYQALAVETLRSGLRGGVKRQMLSSPTGSGKTEIAMAIIRSAMLKRTRVAFLVNRIELGLQASRRFYESQIPHSIIQGANTRNLGERIAICSIQTVARRGLPDCDLLIIDEAHGVAGSKEYRAIIEKANVPMIGLSATPFAKGLGKHYEGLDGPLFERMVIAATIPELIAGGFLVDVEIFAPSAPDMSKFKAVRNASGELDWSDKDAATASDKPELIGDIVEHWLKHAKDTPTVCFAATIAHSEHIVAQFLAAGISAEHIDHMTPDATRKAVLERIKSGDTKVISNVGILCEGWDFPACKTLILARPTKSLIRYLQMAGRVLRPFEGKKRALILDHSGTVSELGFPTDEQKMDLDDGTPKKSKVKEKAAPKARVCVVCKYVSTLFCCPKCGHKPEREIGIETKPGELVKAERFTKIQKQAFYSELLGIQARRGYADGWVSNQYRNKFGVWPKGLVYAASQPTKSTKDYVTASMIRFAKGRGKNAN